MTETNRRNWLKILAAGATGAAALTEACNSQPGPAPSFKTEGKALTGSNILNVIVHGLAGVQIVGNTMQLLIPEVPDHA